MTEEDTIASQVLRFSQSTVKKKKKSMRNIHFITALQGIQELAMEIFIFSIHHLNVKKSKLHGGKKLTSLVKVNRDRGLLRTPTRSVNLSLPNNGGLERGEMKAFPIP